MAFNSGKGFLERYFGSLSRRELFRGGVLLAGPAFLRRPVAGAPPPGLQVGPDIYQSLNVRPFINCRGTVTTLGGSLELPEVRAAADAASRHFVQLDELMEAVGKRLAELTQAEWGIVTAGCTAAVTHATTACVAGGNPDRHVRIPNLEGFTRDEVIIPKHSRNNYDSALRATGVRLIEVHSAAELEAAAGPRTALIYIFTGPRSEVEPPSFDEIARIAKAKNIPVVVDAAAEFLTIPNVHLQRGATMVCYSGGKCIRGPQCAGLLLGRKDLVKAAWVHSAPHHGFARGMKVGKEEIVGMLMAVEMWVRRDHKGEQQLWLSWMEYIAKRVTAIRGVTTELRKPTQIANTPGLSIRWNAAQLGITGEEVANILFASQPRIAISGGRSSGSGAETGISIEAYMMAAGEEKVVADRIHAVLSIERKSNGPAQPNPPTADLTGEWLVRIEYAASTGEQTLVLKQQGNRLAGTQRGEYLARELAGTIDGDSVRIRSSVDETVIGNSLTFTFTGKVAGDTMSGDLDMGEYLAARWSAKRYQYRQRA